MFYRFRQLIVLTVLFSPVTLHAGDLALLSNNIAQGKTNEAFPAGTVIVPTQMTATWVTDGEFATDEETIKTSVQGNSKKMVLFDGNTGSNWRR